MIRSLCLLLLMPSLAWAYTGPGMAIGSVMGVLALLGGILLLVVGTLWYPLKRLLQKFRRQPDTNSANDDAAS